MNVDQDNPELGAIVVSELSPGELLKRAREERRLSHIDIAKQLKLRVQWIVDIENDHYTDAFALIYVRGYLRSYARIVGVSPEKVIAVFDEMKFDEPFVTRKTQSPVREEQFVMHRPVLSYARSKTTRGSSKRVWSWLILIIVLLSVALVMMWRRTEHTSGQNVSSTAERQMPLSPIESIPRQVETSSGSASSIVIEPAVPASTGKTATENSGGNARKAGKHR